MKVLRYLITSYIVSFIELVQYILLNRSIMIYNFTQQLREEFFAEYWNNI